MCAGNEHPPVTPPDAALAVSGWLGPPDAQALRRASLFDVEGSTRDPAALTLLERGDGGLEGAGQEVVVAVQVGDDLAGGRFEALVDRV